MAHDNGKGPSGIYVRPETSDPAASIGEAISNTNPNSGQERRIQARSMEDISHKVAFTFARNGYLDSMLRTVKSHNDSCNGNGGRKPFENPDYERLIEVYNKENSGNEVLTVENFKERMKGITLDY